MTSDEMVGFLKLAFDKYLDGDHEAILSDQAWRLTRDLSVSLIGVLPDPPHIRITTGVVTDVRMHPELAMYLCTVNQQLWNGRAYLVGAPGEVEGSLVLQDIHFGDTLSADFVPSLQSVLTSINTLTQKCKQIAPDVISRFGGRPFDDEDVTKLFD